MGRHVQIFRIEFDADYFICVKEQPELLGVGRCTIGKL